MSSKSVGHLWSYFLSWMFGEAVPSCHKSSGGRGYKTFPFESLISLWSRYLVHRICTLCVCVGGSIFMISHVLNTLEGRFAGSFRFENTQEACRLCCLSLKPHAWCSFIFTLPLTLIGFDFSAHRLQVLLRAFPWTRRFLPVHRVCALWFIKICYRFDVSVRNRPFFFFFAFQEISFVHTQCRCLIQIDSAVWLVFLSPNISQAGLKPLHPPLSTGTCCSWPCLLTWPCPLSSGLSSCSLLPQFFGTNTTWEMCFDIKPFGCLLPHLGLQSFE